MSHILQAGTKQQIATLFNLFPVKALRENWSELKGSKDEITSAIAEENDNPKRRTFIQRSLSICKQHVYVFKSNITPAAFSALSFTNLEALPLPADADITLRSFLTEIDIQVYILADPPQKVSLNYILPLGIERRGKYVLVRFLKFEKNLTIQGIDETNISIRKTDHETDITKQIQKDIVKAGFNCNPADLHAGVKVLWDEDVIDAFRLSFSTPDSVDTKAMNDNKGLKQYNKPVYDSLKHATFFGCLFKTVVPPKTEPFVLNINLSAGFLSLNKYSEQGVADGLISKILAKN